MARSLASVVVFSILAGCGGSNTDFAFQDPGDGDVTDSASSEIAPEDGAAEDGSSSDAASDTSTTTDGASESSADASCTSGATQEEACGKCGKHLRVCNASGAWSDWSACSGETGTCVAGAMDTQLCADGRMKTRTCDATCNWGAFGACFGTPTCTPGATEKQACGFCGEQVRVCGSDTKWSDWSTCSGAGVCAAGTTDTVSCGTMGGTKTRTCSATCSWSAYSLCSTDLDNQLWVVRVNPGGASSAAAPVFVDRIGLDGSFIGTFALPTTTVGSSNALTLPSDDLANDGHLARSADGHSVVLAGYAAAIGTTDVENGTAPRTIGVIDAAGTVDTSRTTTAITSRARGAATSDGTVFWIYGLNGLWRYGSGAQVTSDPIRFAQIVEGSLWISGVTDDLAKFTGLPTTTATATALDPSTAYIYSPGAFFAVARAGTAVDTAYVADDGSSGGPTSGLVRFVRSGTTWTMSSTLPVNLASGEHMEWITGRVEGSNVVLWGSVASSTGSRIVKVTDVAGTTTTFTATTVYTAPTGRKLRGIAFPPR